MIEKLIAKLLKPPIVRNSSCAYPSRCRSWTSFWMTSSRVRGCAIETSLTGPATTGQVRLDRPAHASRTASRASLPVLLSRCRSAGPQSTMAGTIRLRNGADEACAADAALDSRVARRSVQDGRALGELEVED